MRNGTVEIRARERWNLTQLYVKEGERYEFASHRGMDGQEGHLRLARNREG